MSTWKALNVESDNESEDEIDDTKEIQIEEALKLYQTALKHHAEGPQSFEETAAAYKALFESEIFKYTESLSEYKRHELFGETLVFDSILQDDFEAGPVQTTGANDSAPNTLPQILYLSYKNHGQFILETMQHWIRQHGSVSQQEGSTHVLGALGYFAEALDKEDTDLDLWLRTASVAAMLGSKRLTRFCLEAIMDGNDELFESLLSLPGLEEGFAGQQLRELVGKLEDNVSLTQKPLSGLKQKKLANILKKRLNPYPFAPLPAEVADSDSARILPRPPERITLHTTKWDWAGVGEAILRHYITEQSGLSDNIPAGSSINFNIPLGAESPERSDSEPAAAALEESPEKDGLADNMTDGQTSTERNVEDVVMDEPDKNTKPEEAESVTPQESAPALSRKRSTDSAGLPETAEGGRARSKRLRARESIADTTTGGDTAAQDAAKQLEDQLEPYLHADQCLYEIVKDIYAKLGVEGFGEPKKLRELVTSSPDGALATNSIDKTACDMYAALQSAGSKIAPVLLSGEPVDLGGASREAGLNAFLGYAKSTNAQACVKPILESQKLGSFARRVNEGWMSIKEVAFDWLEVLLTPGSFPKQGGSRKGCQSSYMQFRWAEDLKRHLVQIIVNIDDYVYERMVDRVNNLNARMLTARTESHTYELTDFDAFQIEIVETLFELHLDIFSLIKHPHSGVDTATQIIQSDRLERWSALARDVIQLRTACHPDAAIDDLGLRHIWASVFQMSVNDQIDPDYVLFTMEELKSVFSSLGDHTIELQNNAVMPELSVAAIDRELVRISMKDFFLKVFDQDEKDPVAVIESLEPILEPLNEGEMPAKSDTFSHDGEQAEAQSPATIGNGSEQTELQLVPASPYHEMRKFLDSASVNLRLSLWQRLREAYEAIDYPPKVLSCYLRSIETLVGEFKTSVFQESTQAERQVKLISRLRIIDEVVVKVLQTIRSEKTAFDTLSYEHMQTSFSAVAELLHIMYAGNMLQDLIRVGQFTVPRFEGLPANTFINLITRLNDMQLRLWILQYYLLNEGISQNQHAFPAASEDLFEFLRHVHHATGVRCFSHLSSQQFLRLVKDEILRLDDALDANSRDNELSQVLYDLYGLKLFIDPLDCQEFGATSGILDKRTSLTLLPFIMAQAKKVDIKDLPKTDLKVTIEKVHASLGRAKQHDDITFNRKIISTYFKSAINPMSLYNALKGVGSLSTKRIPAEELVAASKGWYFLMGNIALNKFRSQKRLTQGPTEDLNYAQAFFVQDLEYSVDRWETWYRLAQANDAQLEEAVSWTADKMNNNSVELINFQRAAINCYTMAVACVVREGDDLPSTRLKVAQMYTDFGNRIYASSREPFSMNAFDLRENERRWCSEYQTHQTYQRIPFDPLPLTVAWKYASALYKRAIRGNPIKWWNYYMLGKCLWKLYCANADHAFAMAAQGTPVHSLGGPTWEEVIDAFVGAIEMLPEKRARGGEPVLEPHYKLVSIVHKLFQRKAIDHQKGEEILKNTSYSQNLESPDSADDWERYILAVLKALRAADKSSWHHRIIARSAHVIYDDGKDMMVVHGAKHELTQQIFTKTMAVQVWKPENERPGRHFVYTSRYTKFFIHLLDQTGDKANLEALAKRVRRKQTDFFEHSKLWQELCLRYLKLLRRVGKIPDGYEDNVFKSINYDEFSDLTERMEAWCQNPVTVNPVLDILRDAIELKRLNNGLMKPLLIDDLIGDTYGVLYHNIGPSLPPLATEPQQTQHQPIQPAQPTNVAAQPSAGPLSVSSLVQGQAQVDGSTDPNANADANHPFTVYNPNQILQGPSQHQTQNQPDAVPRPRVKTVGRREIQRRAEACAQRPVGAVAAGPVTTSIPIRSPTTLATTLSTQPVHEASPDKAQTEPTEPMEVVEEAAGEAEPLKSAPTGHALTDPAPPPNSGASANDQLQALNSGTATAAASVTNDERSAPASVHDDADDESELSELDESEVQEIQQEAEAEERARRTRSRTASVIAVKPLFPNLIANKNKSRVDDPESETGDAGEDDAEEEDDGEEDHGKDAEEEL